MNGPINVRYEWSAEEMLAAWQAASGDQVLVLRLLGWAIPFLIVAYPCWVIYTIKGWIAAILAFAALAIIGVLARIIHE